MAQYRSAACACLALVPLAGVAGWDSLEKVVTPGGWDFEHGRVPAQSGAAEALAVAFENLACRQNTACAGGEVKMLTLKGMKTGLFASMFQAMARRFSCSLHATPRAAYDICVGGDGTTARRRRHRTAARPSTSRRCQTGRLSSEDTSSGTRTTRCARHVPVPTRWIACLCPWRHRRAHVLRVKARLQSTHAMRRTIQASRAAQQSYMVQTSAQFNSCGQS